MSERSLLASSQQSVSIIIPAFNEGAVIGRVLDEILAMNVADEIIVVDDGSTDDTADVAEQREGVRVLRQAYNLGNGAAIKAGIRAARGDIILMMDGDGQHQPADISRIVGQVGTYDMVVGARTSESDAEMHRTLANRLYNMIASYLVARPVEDLTSGFRALRGSIARRFVYLLPNGFSYPTTLTIALFRAGHTVRYEPIVAPARVGTSKINLLGDGLGFLLTLLRIGTLFVPLRIFLPVSVALLITGLGYGAYLLIFLQRFSNMAVLLLLSAIMMFMLGLISEQIALLRIAQPISLPNSEDRGK